MAATEPFLAVEDKSDIDSSTPLDIFESNQSLCHVRSSLRNAGRPLSGGHNTCFVPFFGLRPGFFSFRSRQRRCWSLSRNVVLPRAWVSACTLHFGNEVAALSLVKIFAPIDEFVKERSCLDQYRRDRCEEISVTHFMGFFVCLVCVPRVTFHSTLGFIPSPPAGVIVRG